MKKKPARKKITQHRSSETGQYVSAEEAQANPDETVTETETLPTAQEAHDAYLRALEREAKGDPEC